MYGAAMPETQDPSLLRSVSAVAASFGCNDDDTTIVAMIVAKLIEDGVLFRSPPADLTPDAQARLSLGRFRDAIPVPDPADEEVTDDEIVAPVD